MGSGNDPYFVWQDRITGDGQRVPMDAHKRHFLLLELPDSPRGATEPRVYMNNGYLRVATHSRFGEAC